jgi:hypothetical protein
MHIRVVFLLFFGANISLAASVPTPSVNSWNIRPFAAKVPLDRG